MKNYIMRAGLIDDFIRNILSIPFCPYHFVRYHFVLQPNVPVASYVHVSVSTTRHNLYLHPYLYLCLTASACVSVCVIFLHICMYVSASVRLSGSWAET